MTHGDWNWTVGTVVAPFGRTGELRASVSNDGLAALRSAHQVCLRPPLGPARLLALHGLRLHRASALLRLEGIATIDDAERWRGAAVQLPMGMRSDLQEGEHYVSDLVGMRVITREGETVGLVSDVVASPAHDLLAVGNILIPMVRQIVTDVDARGRQITVDPPDGLLPSPLHPGDDQP